MSGPPSACLLLLGLSLPPGLPLDTSQGRTAALHDQQSSEWNSPRTRRLIERAIGRRALWAGDDSLRDYRAHAEAHVYFLFDVGRDTERQLVKADQLAIDIFWRAPGETRQVFIGHREEKTLPTDITYHIDHLMVVMDNFADSISLGEGAEVDGVLHPAAPGALAYYDYRLADSLTLVLPERELWVYKVEIRPRDLTGPGVVGAMYLERVHADIVRMEFTFTAASYLDPELDYLNVRLENVLWAGRFWLPFRQGLELRREFKVLAFPAGGIIRTELRIGDYELNVGVPAPIFRGPRVTSLSGASLRGYRFEEGLYDALDPAIASEGLTLEEVRQQATQIVADSYLQRAERLKLAVPGISSVLRFRRAEGLYLGPGLSQKLPGRFEAQLLAGRAFGGDRWEVDGYLRKTFFSGSLEMELAGYVNRVADVSPWLASSGIVSTMSALVDGEDYREPYWASGASLSLKQRHGRTRARLTAAWEDWDSATLAAGDVVDRSYRPVRPMSEGEAVTLALDLDRQAINTSTTFGGAGWHAKLEGSAKVLGGDFQYLRVAVRGESYWPSVVGEINAKLSAEGGGVLGGDIPAQRLFVAGGRGTVRGYDFDRFGGDVFGFTQAELSRGIKYPYISGVIFFDAGWIGLEGENAASAAALWSDAGVPVDQAQGLLLGVGAGAGLLFDIVRVEVARGLRDGGVWEFVFEVNPRFWGWM